MKRFWGYMAAVALLAGCGALQPPIGAQGIPVTTREPSDPSHAYPPLSSSRDLLSNSTGFTHLFSFNVRKGAQPVAGLVSLGGILYGTTQLGGTSHCFGGYNPPGCGTVFKIDATGKQTAIYSFQGAPDGAISFAPLIAVNGVLYGTTLKGGNSSCYSSDAVPGCGTVFKITSSGKQSVLYSFTGGPNDGAFPSMRSPLVFVKGALYGVTMFGGSNDAGVFFRVSLSGKETVLYNFIANSSESDPQSVTFASGAFYGVSQGEGTLYSNSTGSIFTITLAGKKTTVYNFKGSPDGAVPDGQLIAQSHNLYGVTLSGGRNEPKYCETGGCGTAFEVTLGGTEKTLHAFDPQKGDGVLPYSGLTYLNGNFYGALASEGRYGGGVVFKMTPSGKETILHAFHSYDENGTFPYGGVTASGGALYGTTGFGGNTGSDKYGYGTVFKVTP